MPYTLKIVRESDTQAVSFSHAEKLGALLRRAGISIPMPCGGMGRCGKCLVGTAGAFAPPGPREKQLLKSVDTGALFGTPRMACLAVIEGDGTVYLPVEDQTARIVSQGLRRQLPCDPAGADSYGFAADIGTTTIAVWLVSLHTGEVLAESTAPNSQATFGADVLSRIAAAKDRADDLQRAIHSQLESLFVSLITEHSLPAEKIQRIVITGNTTMLHLLTGLDSTGLGVYPFTPASLFGKTGYVVFGAFGGAEVYLPRCVSAYVGADITCGMLVCDLCRESETALLCDVGTNGEMALYSGGELHCCATAAGPAFEGAEIQQGMPAQSGAISRVTWQMGKLACETIGGTPAKGICGSGLITALAALLQAGAVDASGEILDDGHPLAHLTEDAGSGKRIWLGDSGIFLTQKDIRSLQLAKAAIAAGIDTLLHECGITTDKIDRFYLCGGFGKHLDIPAAVDIGLIAAGLQGKVVFAGNTALSGACELLLRGNSRRETEGLASGARELSLSANPWFMDRYVAEMSFPKR